MHQLILNKFMDDKESRVIISPLKDEKKREELVWRIEKRRKRRKKERREVTFISSTYSLIKA